MSERNLWSKNSFSKEARVPSHLKLVRCSAVIEPIVPTWHRCFIRLKEGSRRETSVTITSDKTFNYNETFMLS